MIKTINRIKSNEGLELFPYKCPAGKWTIGYGRNLEDKGLSNVEKLALLGNDNLNNEEVILYLRDKGITEQMAELLINNDVKECYDKVMNTFPWAMANRDVVSVLVEMVFQMGLSGVLNFRNTISYLKKKMYDKAAAEMLDSNWHNQTPTRAEKLSLIIKNISK